MNIISISKDFKTLVEGYWVFISLSVDYITFKSKSRCSQSKLAANYQDNLWGIGLATTFRKCHPPPLFITFVTFSAISNEAQKKKIPKIQPSAICQNGDTRVQHWFPSLLSLYKVAGKKTSGKFNSRMNTHCSFIKHNCKAFKAQTWLYLIIGPQAREHLGKPPGMYWPDFHKALYQYA